MMHRREVIALLGGLAPSAAACAGARGGDDPRVQAPAMPALGLDPIVDLVPAAGLVWLVHARAREAFGAPEWIPAIALVAPEARLDAFARRHGGVDLRQANEIAIAGFESTTLAVVRAVVDPARIERAFADRAVTEEGRAIERDGVLRFWGSVGADREQVAVLGREAVALERGAFGPLRAAIAFAQGRLKRALPALRAEPLSTAARLVGDGSEILRAFAPGPFGGEWGAGLGGLLRAATAVGMAAKPRGEGAVALTFVLTGAWGDDARPAADRLLAAFDVLAADTLGHLAGLTSPRDRPIEGPRVSSCAEAIALHVTFDALSLARGFRAVTGSSAAEIFAY